MENVNTILPQGNVCPKCSGFYSWSDPHGHCLCCGYHYNPPLERNLFTIHCAFKCCLASISSFETVYCPKHDGEEIDQQALQNIEKQKRYVRKTGGMQDDGQIRLNAPIMVKLKPHHKKTVA